MRRLVDFVAQPQVQRQRAGHLEIDGQEAAIRVVAKIISSYVLGNRRCVQQAQQEVAEGIAIRGRARACPNAVSRHGPARIIIKRLVEQAARQVHPELEHMLSFDPGQLVAKLIIRHEILDGLVGGVSDR